MLKKHSTNNINSKGRKKYDDRQFTPLHHSMIQSPQFRGLSGNELKVLLEICSRHGGYNNGKIAAGMKDLSDKLLIGKSTVQRVLIALEGFGFIKRVKRGQFTGRTASEWKVTFIQSEGMRASNDWGQKKARTQRRKKPPKSLLQEMSEYPELKEFNNKKIEAWYQNETKEPP